MVVVGLGNPGLAYEQTRHNLGFNVLDAFAKKNNLIFKHQAEFQAQIASFSLAQTKVFLLKPLTFMNLSGQSVSACLRYHRVEKKNICVLHDDIAFDVGQAKLSYGSGSGGHNGLKSLNQALGEPFWRFRLGIGQKYPSSIDLSDFVLGRFSDTEKKILSVSINFFIDGLEKIIVQRPEQAICFINQNRTHHL